MKVGDRSATADANGRFTVTGVPEIGEFPFVNGVREYSGGRLTAGGVETGTEGRPASTGWVNVLFQRQISGPANTVGRATLGGNQGTMWLRFDPDDPRLFVNDPSGCCARVVQVAAHEMQHTMGYYHTSGSYAALYADPDCDGANLSESLRYHGGVMYSRPRGNTDPDTDPDGFTLNATAEGASPSCPAPRRTSARAG